MSGSYKINGVELSLQPTTGRWLPRPLVGTTGDGHHIYPAIREYEMRWGLANPSDADEWYTQFDLLGVTGTVVMDLPKFPNSVYAFESYSGCTLQEPIVNTYFTEHFTDVVLLVTNIRT